MNKLLKSISVLLLFAPIFTSGQIEVAEVEEPTEIGEVKLVGNYYGSVHYYSDIDRYTLRFRNLEYQYHLDIASIELKETEFNQLYALLIKNIQSGQKKKFDIDISGQDVRLKFEKGKVSFWLWDGYNYSVSMYFNKRQINTLFGKQ